MGYILKLYLMFLITHLPSPIKSFYELVINLNQGFFNEVIFISKPIIPFSLIYFPHYDFSLITKMNNHQAWYMYYLIKRHNSVWRVKFILRTVLKC